MTAYIVTEKTRICSCIHWLPSSGYVHDNRPEIEVYPDGTGVYVEFWLTVRKNSPQ